MFYLALYAGPGSRATRDLQLIDQRGDNFAASAGAGSSGGLETTRIEQTRGKFKKNPLNDLNRIESNVYHITEIVREYGGMDTAGGVFSNYPTMSSRYGDFARDAHHQQSSSAYSQRRNMHEYDRCLAFFLFIACDHL